MFPQEFISLFMTMMEIKVCNYFEFVRTREKKKGWGFAFVREKEDGVVSRKMERG